MMPSLDWLQISLSHAQRSSMAKNLLLNSLRRVFHSISLSLTTFDWLIASSNQRSNIKPIHRASMTLNSPLTLLSPHQVVLLAMLSKLTIMLMELPLVSRHQSITSLLPASTSPPPSRTKSLVSRVPLIIQLL